MQGAEVLDGFAKGAGGGRALGLVFCEGEDVGREEGEAEAEVRGWEDCEGFDEDVGCCFVAREVRVELVSISVRSGLVSAAGMMLENVLVGGGR